MGGKKTDSKSGGDEYSFDINCDYVALDNIAETFKSLLANQNAGNLVSMAGSPLKASGHWDGQEAFVTAFREAGQHVNEDIEKLEKLADRMKKVAEAMRLADESVGNSL